MKRHILVTSLVVNVWIAVGGLAFSGCNQSLTSAPSPSGAHKSNAPGTGGANSGDSATDVEMDALPPAASVPVCSTMVSFARSKVLLELGPLGTILGSVTPDELTVAWTIPGSFSPGGSLPPSVRVADRDASDSEFGSPQTVDMGTLSIGQDKVALSPDGLRLVAVRADLQGFVELRRPDRSSAFSSFLRERKQFRNRVAPQMFPGQSLRLLL